MRFLFALVPAALLLIPPETLAITNREWNAIPVARHAINTTRWLASSSPVKSYFDDLKGFLDSIATPGKLDATQVVSKISSVDFTILSKSIDATVPETGKSNSWDAISKDNDASVKAVSAALSSLTKQLASNLEESDAITEVTSIFTIWKSLQTYVESSRGQLRVECGRNSHDPSAAMNKLAVTTFKDVTDPTALASTILSGMVMGICIHQFCTSNLNPRVDLSLIGNLLLNWADTQSDAASKKLLINTFMTGLKSGNVPTNQYAAVNSGAVDSLNKYLDSHDDLLNGTMNAINSPEWRQATSSNTAAGSGAAVVAAAIAKASSENMKDLTALDNVIVDTHNIRMDKIGEISTKVDTWHTKKMDQISSMKTTFTGQHQERMTALTNVDTKVRSITSQASQGFSKFQSDLQGVQSGLQSQISRIDGEIKADAGETTNYLSNALIEAGNQRDAQINRIDSQVRQGAEVINQHLERAQQVVQNEFDATQNTLTSASENTAKFITEAMTQLQNTVVSTYTQVRDIVTDRIQTAADGLSEELSSIDRKLQITNNRLEVLETTVTTVQEKLAVATQLLLNLEASIDIVADRLRGLSSDIAGILFEGDLEDLNNRFSNLREKYSAYVSKTSSRTIFAMKTACDSNMAYDLFISFVNLIDIDDSQIPDQMQKFGHMAKKYEQFGMAVVGSMVELSLLSNLCSGLGYTSLSRMELNQKATEHDSLIRRTAGQFTRHVDEILPIYMIRYYITSELEAASTQQWGDATAKQARADTLRGKLQDSIGDFAQITVFYAGDGTIELNHLDELASNTSDIRETKRHGVLLSSNKKLGVMWGSTIQLPTSEHAQIDDQELLRQGIYRGYMRSSDNRTDCAVSQDTSVYPRCTSCNCMHYEYFASTTSSTAGRAITLFNSSDFDSDFAVMTTTDPFLDYEIQTILLQVDNVGSAQGRIRAPALSKSRAQQERVLWEGFSDTGKIKVAPANVKGTLLYKNELELTLQYTRSEGATESFRRVIQLFCNGRRQIVTYTAPKASFQYTCRENARTSLEGSSNTLVVGGVPASRMQGAVCASTSTEKRCRVVGALDEVPLGFNFLDIGQYVTDLTVFSGSQLSGSFAICKGCTATELQASGIALQSFSLETPELSVLPFLDVTCTKTSETLMVCRE